MTTYWGFKLTDIMGLSFVNPDQLTEADSTTFYGAYVTHWPEYKRMCLHLTTGICMAYTLGEAEEFHGHVSAVTVAPMFCRLGLEGALMTGLEITTSPAFITRTLWTCLCGKAIKLLVRCTRNWVTLSTDARLATTEVTAPKGYLRRMKMR
ncbi:N-acetyltransferase complex ARD1 subunit [Trypanosoma rangeli]|uniref:N-acetyltransferase complex ARD1 subunit n=1 Tax=Trypanosoma rangeli TaxID=5698 RepID=A0A422MUX3_TRYRA|nr:N-acetyltransferase complex ARD1 subunit [Trypanosoma rangeli]RNE96990.1 N-acetyltransferase complex ARD1 subunit [Trypanosoma rangeli]|eukprot:RNE96990.1 N-acetyltransferase complex ARD1 subunit [Trypanosoma rangeli]